MFVPANGKYMAKVIPLKNLKHTPKFKYALNEQLGNLNRNTKISEVIDHLAKWKVSKDEFYRDRNIEYGSPTAIPEDRLFIYCKVFDCTVEDLINYQPVKATSLRTIISKIKTPLK